MKISRIYLVLLVCGLWLVSGCASSSGEGGEVSVAEQEIRVQSMMLDSDIVPVGDSPILGNPDAPITIVDFSSLQCPFCARGNETLQLILEQYPDAVRIVSKSFPLEFQPQSRAAARAALAAGEQGKYWEMRALLFENMQLFSTIDMTQLVVDLATQLGLDVEQFRADLQKPELDASITQDLALGNALGVRGTPHYFINGVRISGAQPLPMFDAVIQHLLAQAEELTGAGMEPEAVYREMVAMYYQEPQDAAQPARGAEPQELEPGALEIGDSYVRGAEDAPITIYEFSSFQCPFCKRGAETVRQVMSAYPGQVRLVYKSYPLPMHAYAEPASRAALAAGRQGKFWEMYDLIYENQERLKEEGAFEELAEKAGVDLAQFRKDLEDPAIQAQVEREQAEGARLHVRGTPTFFINGTPLVGAQPLESFQRIIDAKLAELSEGETQE